MDGQRSVDSSPEYCLKACERSLQRLGVSHIDLYYAHRLDGVTPIEKTVEAMKKLKDEGKIKYLGLSECSSESLRRACKVVHIDAVQIEYSPFSLDIESEQIGLLKTCRELGCAIVAYSPIGRGMLGGQIRSPKDFEDGDFRKYVLIINSSSNLSVSFANTFLECLRVSVKRTFRRTSSLLTSSLRLPTRKAARRAS